MPPEDGFWGVNRGPSTSLEGTWTPVTSSKARSPVIAREGAKTHQVQQQNRSQSFLAPEDSGICCTALDEHPGIQLVANITFGPKTSAQTSPDIPRPSRCAFWFAAFFLQKHAFIRAQICGACHFFLRSADSTNPISESPQERVAAADLL